MYRFMIPFVALVVGVLGLGQALAQDSESITFKNWVVNCVNPEGGTSRCQISHTVLEQGTQQGLLTFLVDYDSETGGYTLFVSTLLGVKLDSGATLTVGDDQFSALYTFSHCEPGGCIIETELEGELLAAMRLAESGTVTVEHIQRQELPIPFSLLGFGAALDELERRAL